MKTFKSLMVLFFVFCLFVMPVSAFSDDFEDQDILDWNVISGVWIAGNGTGITGINDYYLYNNQGVGAVSEIEIETTGVTNNYIEFNFKSVANLGGASTATTHIYLFDNDVSSHGFTISSTSTTQEIDADGWAYNPYSLSANTWYKIAITRTASNIKVDIYDLSDNLLDTQTSAYTLLSNADRIRVDNQAFIGGSISIFIDNIYTSNVAPTTVTGINWDENEYVIGEQGRYEWALSNSFWDDLFTSYSVVILKNGEQVKFSKVSQVGRGFYNFEDVGEYTAKIRSAPISLFNIVWTDVDTDTTRVYDTVDSSIFVPQTVAAGVPFDIEYNYGFSPLFPKIIYQHFEDGQWDYISSWKDISDEDNLLKTTYYVNDSLSRIGEHRIILADDEKGEVASIAFNVIFVDRPIEQNVTSSLITVDDNTLYWGEFATGTYKIDNNNYSNYLTRIDVYDETLEYIVGSISVNEQVGNYYTDFIRSAGNKSLQLVAYNISNNKVAVLDSVNISVTSTTAGGYSLTSNVDTISVNQEYTLSIVSPGSCELVVYNVDSAEPYETFSLSGSISLNLIAHDDVGKMLIRLRDDTGKTVVTKIITVIAGAVVVIEDDTTPTQNTIDMVIMFLSMPAFWGMVIWVGVVGGASQSKAVNASSTGYIAFAFGNILAIVGLFAPYTMYILVILWIGAGVFFKLGHDAAGGEEY